MVQETTYINREMSLCAFILTTSGNFHNGRIWWVSRVHPLELSRNPKIFLFLFPSQTHCWPKELELVCHRNGLQPVFSVLWLGLREAGIGLGHPSQLKQKISHMWSWPNDVVEEGLAATANLWDNRGTERMRQDRQPGGIMGNGKKKEPFTKDSGSSLPAENQDLQHNCICLRLLLLFQL